MENRIAEKSDIFESDKILKSILIMAIPTIISQIITMVYNYADTVYIGLLENPSMIAAIALAQPVNLFMTATGNIFGVGGSSMLSRAMGEHDFEKAKKASAFSIYFAAIFIIVCAVVAFLFKEKLAIWLGATDTALVYAKQYLLWIFVLGGFPSIMSQVLAHFARAQGYSREAGLGLTIGGVVNIILDPIFIFDFGLGLGLKGAAIATAISNYIALIYYIRFFYSKRKTYFMSFEIKYAKPEAKVAGEVFSVGLPAALIHIMSAASNLVLNNVMSDYGDVALAAVGIAKKVDTLPASIGIGIAQGSLPLIAYNYSAGNYDRMSRFMKTSRNTAFIACVGIAALIIIFARPISLVFIREPETVACATELLRILSYSPPFLAIAFTITTAFQAIKRPKESLLLSLIRKGPLDIPFMILVAGAGPRMIMAVQPIMDCVSSIVCVIVLGVYLKRNFSTDKKL